MWTNGISSCSDRSAQTQPSSPSSAAYTWKLTADDRINIALLYDALDEDQMLDAQHRHQGGEQNEGFGYQV